MLISYLIWRNCLILQIIKTRLSCTFFAKTAYCYVFFLPKFTEDLKLCAAMQYYRKIVFLVIQH